MRGCGDRKTRRGFTLVEIMMVLGIIAMLASIALPYFVTARQRAWASACQRNLVQIDSAKERWAMDNSMNGTDTPQWTDLVGSDLYLKFTPVCPAGGVYTINEVDTDPTCSIGGVAGTPYAHVLPD